MVANTVALIKYSRVFIVGQGSLTSPVCVPVVLCGGKGGRLSPVSTPAFPKQFFSRTQHSPSFFQMAISRALLCGDVSIENIVIVTRGAYQTTVRQQIAAMGLSPDAPHIIAEPEARNTGAAIYLAARYIADNFSDDTVMLILPSDHIIENSDEMARAVRVGVAGATAGKIITMGLQPTTPSSSYGYIRAGECDDCGIAPITAFVEKPSQAAASAYVRRGYLWNSGIFMACPQVLVQEFSTLAPSIAVGVDAAARIAKKRVQFDVELYKTIPAAQFDCAILEKTDKACVIASTLEWQDIGSDAGYLYQHSQEGVTKNDYQAEQRSI